MRRQQLANCVYFVVAFVYLTACAPLLANENSEHIHIEPIPPWVIQRETQPVEAIPKNDISGGTFYEVVEDQIQVLPNGERNTYVRYVETIVNQAGLDSSSQINIDFDPAYQSVALNTLFIIRSGQRFDRLTSAKKTILHTEKELDSQIYNESLTLNVLIPDLQVGDTLSYSYTRHGANPIYQPSFSYQRHLNWSVPVHNQFLRLLWGKPNQLYLKTRNIDLEIQETQQGEVTEYQIEVTQADVIEAESQRPGWYDPYGTIMFTEAEAWNDVIDWASTQYSLGSTHPSVQVIAESIKQQHTDESDQIVAALKYAQDNIRYVGLEMGLNSHIPTSPQETLQLNYGDCKDKTMLLMSLLKALGIQSYAALIHTGDTKLITEFPPSSNIFDHVITMIEREGKRVWLDPTLTHQQGRLTNLYQPDYGYALVLKPDENALTNMSQDNQNSYTKITEEYFIPEAHEARAKLMVSTEYSGANAVDIRRRLERDGMKSVADSYETFYQKSYPQLTAQGELGVTTDSRTGKTIITEHYLIGSFWVLGDEHYEADFYPSDIRVAAFKPDKVVRNAPLAFQYPNNATNTIIVHFEQDGWQFEDEKASEDNAFFSFEKQVSFADDTLILDFDYTAKTDHIAPDDIDTYLAAREILREEAYFGILKYVDNNNTQDVATAEDTNGDESISWWALAGILYVIAFLFILTSWRLESRKRPTFEHTYLYPISLSRFIVLSIGTLGLYEIYWSYRNWKAIEENSSDALMPLARGIFATIWFYPLFLRLKADSIERNGSNRVIMTPVAVILATAYLALSVSSWYFDGWQFFALALSTSLLYVPFVCYINKVNGSDSQAYSYNARWRVRHGLAVVAFAPVIALTFAMETAFVPSSSVITQPDILDRDLKFMYRKKIVLPSETIHYFYSSGFFSIKEDGNGFTDNSVFSFWTDEDDVFQSNIAAYDKIKNIEVLYADDELNDTTITITKDDDSTFLLFVSSEDSKDRLFFRKLSELWKAQRYET